MTVKRLPHATYHQIKFLLIIPILEPKERLVVIALKEKPLAIVGNVPSTAQRHVRADSAKLSAKGPQDSQPHCCTDAIYRQYDEKETAIHDNMKTKSCNS